MKVTLLNRLNNREYIYLSGVKRFYMIGDSTIVIVFLDGSERFYNNYHYQIIKPSLR